MFRPETIVCPVDLSNGARGGVRAAAELARRSGAALHLVHAIDTPVPAQAGPGPPTLPEMTQLWEAAQQGAKTEFAAFTGDMVAGIEERVTREVLVGSPFRRISEYAGEVHADLVVMASRDRQGIIESVLGSVAERVLRLAQQPVLTVPPTAEGFTPRRVVVATDLRPRSDRAFPVISYLAREFDPELTLAHVIHRRGQPHELADSASPPADTEEYWRQVRSAAINGLRARREMFGPGADVAATLIESDDPGKAIVELAARQRADLVVCGTSGNSGLSRLLLGSIAEKIVRSADCAVLAVPPDSFDEVERFEPAFTGSATLDEDDAVTRAGAA